MIKYFYLILVKKDKKGNCMIHPRKKTENKYRRKKIIRKGKERRE